ncbi:hypothetical protein D2E26_0955 [Bifidobacterium dolichotidis]|uniref:Uncharacterized protein n=1 Tax=Bifidobacterium dolichotidis TaxID=2306976 RepID=A0A430FPZ6_9BIFI|nr:hypothetical protein [Bifidobacterium dolichotidis]RSX54901.1 hypothetical protein D2E26_0955 [Bifidobacterium dolichotidis]
MIDRIFTTLSVLPWTVQNSIAAKKQELSAKYGAWFVVFLAVLIALCTAFFLAMSAYCMIAQHGYFTGNWNFKKWFTSVELECKPF